MRTLRLEPLYARSGCPPDVEVDYSPFYGRQRSPHAAAVPAEGKTVKAWVYRKDGTHLETNIANIGKEHDFYGKDGEPNTDVLITELENLYAPLVEALRNEPDGAPAKGLKVPELVAHLTRRSNSFRSSFVGSTQMVLRGVLPPAKAEIEKRLKAEIKKGRQRLLREKQFDGVAVQLQTVGPGYALVIARLERPRAGIGGPVAPERMVEAVCRISAFVAAVYFKDYDGAGVSRTETIACVVRLSQPKQGRFYLGLGSFLRSMKPQQSSRSKISAPR